MNARLDYKHLNDLCSEEVAIVFSETNGAGSYPAQILREKKAIITSFVGNHDRGKHIIAKKLMPKVLRGIVWQENEFRCQNGSKQSLITVHTLESDQGNLSDYEVLSTREVKNTINWEIATLMGSVIVGVIEESAAGYSYLSNLTKQIATYSKFCEQSKQICAISFAPSASACERFKYKDVPVLRICEENADIQQQLELFVIEQVTQAEPLPIFPVLKAAIAVAFGRIFHDIEMIILSDRINMKAKLKDDYLLDGKPAITRDSSKFQEIAKFFHDAPLVSTLKIDNISLRVPTLWIKPSETSNQNIRYESLLPTDTGFNLALKADNKYTLTTMDDNLRELFLLYSKDYTAKLQVLDDLNTLLPEAKTVTILAIHFNPRDFEEKIHELVDILKKWKKSNIILAILYSESTPEGLCTNEYKHMALQNLKIVSCRNVEFTTIQQIMIFNMLTTPNILRLNQSKLEDCARELVKLGIRIPLNKQSWLEFQSLIRETIIAPQQQVSLQETKSSRYCVIS